MSTEARLRRPSFSDLPRPAAPYVATSFIVLGLVVTAALGILTIGARSPYTHANLMPGYDARYGRTEQILVGATTEFGGMSPSVARGDDPVARGASLYVTAGCVTCHAIEGKGGPVGPPIAGIEAEIAVQRAREGPGGMPQFSADGLTDEQIADIAAYLATLETETAP